MHETRKGTEARSPYSFRSSLRGPAVEGDEYRSCSTSQQDCRRLDPRLLASLLEYLAGYVDDAVGLTSRSSP
jgi:hypothetical protein